MSGDPVGEALLARIHEDPEDEAARLVFIDHLLERGDPRGELLLLEGRLAIRSGEPGALDGRELARMNALRAENEERWLGPIAAVTTRGSRRYFRGFLDACEIVASEGDDLGSAIGRPEWSTVTRLERGGRCRPIDLVALIRDTRMPILRSVGRLDPTATALLARDATPRPIVELSLFVLRAPAEGVVPPDLVAAFSGEAPGLPALRRLFIGFPRAQGTRASTGFDPRTFGWLFASTVGRRLETLGVAIDEHPLDGWYMLLEQASGAALRELILLPSAAVGSPGRILGHADGEVVTLGSEPGAAPFSRLTVSGAGPDARTLVRALALLPDDALVHVDLHRVRGPSRRLGVLLEVLERQRRLEELVVEDALYESWGDERPARMLPELAARGVRVRRV